MGEKFTERMVADKVYLCTNNVQKCVAQSPSFINLYGQHRQNQEIIRKLTIPVLYGRSLHKLDCNSIGCTFTKGNIYSLHYEFYEQLTP